MSVVKANTYQDASGGSNAVFSGVSSPPNSMGFRNRLINGDMRIDQRNAGASVASGYTVDRWLGRSSTDGTLAFQQTTSVVPTGFSHALGVTVTVADSSLSSTQFASLVQYIEGFNSASLSFGSASAQTVTLSFWVRSSLTGTFGGSLSNSDLNRSYAFTYTISAANTWEQKSVTVAGDTTGTWLTNNGIGLRVTFGLGVGSAYSGTAGSWSAAELMSATGATSVIGTNGATWYITGVQLEAGTNASAFDRRDYGRELIMCERYYQKYTGNSTGLGSDSGFVGIAMWSSTAAYTGVTLPQQMRSAPSLSYSAIGDFTLYSNGVARSLSTFVINGASTNRLEFNIGLTSAATAGDAAWVRLGSSSAWYALSAEL